MKRNKLLWFILICLLTLYAPIELSRVIADFARDYGDVIVPTWQLMAEIAWIWASYLTGMVIIWQKLT